MIDANLCRKLINRRIDRIKRVFQWAVSKALVPVTVYQALQTLAGRRAGRTEARESKPVKPSIPSTSPPRSRSSTVPDLRGRHPDRPTRPAHDEVNRPIPGPRRARRSEESRTTQRGWIVDGEE